MFWAAWELCKCGISAYCSTKVCIERHSLDDFATISYIPWDPSPNWATLACGRVLYFVKCLEKFEEHTCRQCYKQIIKVCNNGDPK